MGPISLPPELSESIQIVPFFCFFLEISLFQKHALAARIQASGFFFNPIGVAMLFKGFTPVFFFFPPSVNLGSAMAPVQQCRAVSSLDSFFPPYVPAPILPPFNRPEYFPFNLVGCVIFVWFFGNSGDLGSCVSRNFEFAIVLIPLPSTPYQVWGTSNSV